MTKINLPAAKVFAMEATAQIRAGAIEDVLRHLLSARLPLMFPDNPWWIQEHSIGAETHVHYIDATGKMRSGFIDSLVGKTAIEYEKNLTIRAIYDEGYHQVEEYCSSLLNRGEPCDDIIGVLSDTVHWYAFLVRIENEPLPGSSYGPANITLEKIDEISLENHSDDNLNRFELFINRYLGRKGSRHLNSLTLTMDLGFDSSFYEGHILGFRVAVDEAFSSREHYGDMISSLWQNFVIRFESDGANTFNREAYTNELYIMTLAKLLCANILNGAVIGDNAVELEGVLNGQWFKERGFVNLVEYDYFGWLNEPPVIDRLLTIAREMQNDLAAYDYKNIVSQDLFGSLMAQLADKDRRLLLGQEFTPQWIATKMVTRAISFLSDMEYPNFVDMCCGSGVFIVETLKQTMERYNITSTHCSNEKISVLMNCVVGFDIDPLAVLLAKLNWAMAMREFVGISHEEMVIPIYHADSLFAAAPLTSILDSDYEIKNIQMDFDGNEVTLPGFLVSPQNRRLFDAYIQKSYDVAKAKSRAIETEYTRGQAESLVIRLINETSVILNDDQHDILIDSCISLIPTLEKLQRNGHNGIWPFLLGNSYRPGLVREQFNAIISNPPWMAMSKLANNPYKFDIESRVIRFGIKPPGSSHLHAELATVFLLNAIDKYLKEGAYCGVVLPDTLLNGYHHEPFRRQKYRHAKSPVDFRVDEIWELPADAFKNKAIVIFGQKSDTENPATIAGRRIFADKTDEMLDYRMLQQGRRTAWSPNSNAQSNTGGVCDRIPFLQGADIMPRTLVFHNAKRQPNGNWDLSPISRQKDSLSYLVCDAKNYKSFSLNVKNIDNNFIYDCYLSKHILPFILYAPAKALIPMIRVNERPCVVNETDLVLYGSSTSAAFAHIFSEAEKTAAQYFDKINTRNKLDSQNFIKASDEQYIVLYGAGGKTPCAAYLSIRNIKKDKLIIDQTLYWHIAQTENEAIYITALINSQALNTIITDYQPRGAFGERHIHKLVCDVTPPFDESNPSHIRIVDNTRELISNLERTVSKTDLMSCPPRSITDLGKRRGIIRGLIKGFEINEEYESACRDVFEV